MSDTAPDTSQGVSVGDAVLTFLGDTTHLDAAFNRVADEAAVSMGKAASSVGQVGDAVDGLSDSMAVGQQGAVKLGEVTTLAGKQARESMYQARGETQLLGEMFGIHLPRHVRSFIAELPGVGTALSAAFTATAVLFLLDALVKGIEKIKEFANIASEIQTAWEGVDKVQRQMFANLDDNLLKAGARTADLTNNPLEALRLKLQLLDNQSLAKLDGELEKLGQEADKAFDKMDRNWFSKMFLGLEGAEEAKNKFDEVGKAVDAALSTRTPESFANALKAVDQGIDGAKAKLKELEEQQKQANASNADMGQGPTSGPDPRTAHAFTEAIKRLEAYKAAITEAQNTEHEEADNTSLEEHLKQVGEAASAAGKEASRQAAEAQHALNDQLENIKDFVSQQHSLYENHKIDLATLQAAEVHATDATAIAHEHYLQTLVRIYQQAAGVVKGQAATQMDAQQSLVEGYAKSGDAVRAQTAQLAKNALEAKSSAAATDLLAKAQSAQEELATLRKTNDREATDALNAALEKQRENTRKVVEEYAHLVDAGVEKEFLATARAAKELSAADEELSKAQTKLAEDKLTQKYKDQEDAITKLAAMHLITEEQKDDRLKLLEQQQADAAIAILNQQLAKEKAAMDAAQATVSYGKNNPLTVSPAQLAEAEASLAKLATAYTNTQAQIVEAQEKFHKESEANDKSHYGRALLEAMAYGNELLAEGMRENHAALIAKEGELAQAKARHENTDAIKEEIAALKQKEEALEKTANGDTKAAAALLKNDQAQLATAKSALADAQARGVDTSAIKQHILALEADTAALSKAVNGDRLLAAQKLISNQADVLQLQILRDLLKARGADTLAIDQNIIALQNQQKALQQQATEIPKVKTGMQGLRLATQQLKDMMKSMASEMANAFATAIMGALESGKSIGAALEAATSKILEQLATQALAKALYYTAEGIAAATMMNGQAPGFFAAAAEFALVAGAAGAAGIAMSGSGSGSGQSAAPSPGQTTSSSAGGGGTNQTGSVTKLAEGGIVSKPTMISTDVMAGDSPSGGAADEAILPLSDPSAMRQVANAIAPGGLPQSTPQEESGFDPESIKRMTEAISALTGTRDAAQEFHFAQPGTGEKPGFQFAGSTAQTEKSGFSSAAESATVGEALGFTTVAPSPHKEGAFTHADPDGAHEGLEFSSGQASSSEKPTLDFSQPSAGERPGFNYSAPSLPREMPDMESLATQFGGLLSAPTLRAASDAHVPAAAVSASSSSQPVDIEGRMERFAEKMGAQSNPDNHPPVGDTTHIHVKGLMDAGNLKRIIKKQNLLVKNRQATVNASNSLRITRRSQ